MKDLNGEIRVTCSLYTKQEGQPTGENTAHNGGNRYLTQPKYQMPAVARGEGKWQPRKGKYKACFFIYKAG